MKLRKWMSFVIALVLLVGCMQIGYVTVNAIKSGDYQYDVVNGTAVVTSYSGSSDAITIPSTFDGYIVTGIGDKAFFNSSLHIINIPNTVIRIGFSAFESSALQSLSIPSSVKIISDYAFYNCDGLSDLIIPSSVTTIGDNAFADCINFSTVSIGANVTSFGNQVFSGCANLKNVTIVDGLVNLGENTFSYCTSLENVNIPGSVKSIGSGTFKSCSTLKSVNLAFGLTEILSEAFYECKNISHITIPESVTSIGDQAFYKCSSLVNLLIPNSVTQIGNGSFTQCTSLKSLNISESVASIGSYAFYECMSISEILVDSNSQYFSSIDGVLYNKDATILIQYPIAKTGAFKLPNSVTTIGKSAFNSCKNITDISIPDGVTSIGDDAFAGCLNLVDLSISDSVTNVGSRAFDGTGWFDQQPIGLVYAGLVAYAYKYVYSIPETGPKIESITIKDGTKGIANEAFISCRLLKSVALPDSLNNIGESAFKMCSALTQITIPAGVTSIGENAFWGCTSLTNISASESNGTFSSQDGILYNLKEQKLEICPEGKAGTILVPEGILGVSDKAFFNCTLVTSVSLPIGLESIGAGAFNNCSSLLSILIPDSVKQIGHEAFQNCSSLTNVKLPIGVKSIERDTFSYCSKLASVTISDELTSIGKFAFLSCNSLGSIRIPKSVIDIGDYAFANCDLLSTVILSDGIENIGSYSFSTCAIKEITIPDSVRLIEANTFYMSKSFTIYGNYTAYVKSFAFDNCISFVDRNHLVVTYDTMGGSGVADVVARFNNNISNPTQPTKKGYMFKGWYSAASGGSKVSFPYTVTGDVTFYAQWTAVSTLMPSGLKAIPSAYNAAKVSWAALAGMNKYEVYRATSSTGAYTRVGTVTTTSFINTGLTCGTTYYYKVRGVQVVGTTSSYTKYSLVVSAKPMLATPKVTAVKTSTTSIKVSWGAISGATGYEVQWSTSAIGTYPNIKTGLMTNSYTNTSLKKTTTYYYKVRAYKTVGTTKVYGAYSTVVSAKT